MIKVIDVSSYQSNINYQKVKDSSIKGVILRCGRTYWGSLSVAGDDCFEKHYKGFKAVGMPLGVYYYSAANTIEKAQEEARFVLNVLKDKQLEYPVYYDVENSERQGALNKQQLTDIVKAFCSMVENAGYYVGVYASSSWLINKLDMLRLQDYDTWVAHYGVTRPSYSRKYGMWQYSSKGAVSGINGDVDLNNCYMDYPSIIQNAGLNGYGGQKDNVDTSDQVSVLEAKIKALENEKKNMESNYNKQINTLQEGLDQALAKIKQIKEIVGS